VKRAINIIFLMAIVILLSGCHAECNLYIQKDDSLVQTTTLLEDNDVITDYAPDVRLFIDTNISQNETNGTIKSDDYVDVITGNKESGASITSAYNNFDLFKQTTILKNNFYSDMKMTTTGDLVNLRFDSIASEYALFNKSSDGPALLKKFDLKITVPYEVTSNDADEVDTIKNIYTWHYDKLTLYKDVNLTYDKSKEFKVTIFDKLEVAYKKGDLTKAIVIGSIVLVALVIVITVAIKNKHSNKI
jgi:hypothetical protein